MSGFVMNTSKIRQRFADLYGETVVVRDHSGVKVLTDPVDESVVVVVRSGRRARLVRFSFCGLSRPCGRDTLTVVFKSDAGTGFACVGRPNLSVLLRDLPEGQVVDILPAAESAVAYAALRRPLPVLYGAAVAQPIYAAVAA